MLEEAVSVTKNRRYQSGILSQFFSFKLFFWRSHSSISQNEQGGQSDPILIWILVSKAEERGGDRF